MQKLDFVKNLTLIADKLDSKTIVEIFESGFRTPMDIYKYGLITPHLFSSKSNYDQLKSNPDLGKFFSSLNTEVLYDQKTLSALTNMFVTTNIPNLLGSSLPLHFYNLHKTIIQTLKLAQDVLLNDITELSFEQNLERGVILFQILIEGEGLETEKYLKIITAIQELVDVLAKINGEDPHAEIILLDSGSDTNMGIKAGVETAKSLFLVFKEIWDYVTNFKHYKQGQTNKAILDSLSVREEIKKKVDAKVITAEEGNEYAHLVKTRTDNLIGMKVMPKQIILGNNEISNKQLLTEFEGYKMLNQSA